MKLVSDARRAWRWFSMQAMAAALAVQATWAALPADMKADVPEQVHYALTGILLVCGILGRMVDQK